MPADALCDPRHRVGQGRDAGGSDRVNPRERLLALFAFALLPIGTLAQEPVSLESIASGHFGKETYCESGKWGTHHPTYGFRGVPFSRCAHSDGRFKVVQYMDQPNQDVLWSDGGKFYRHAPAANYYQESRLDDAFMLSFPTNRSELYPIYLSRVYNQYSANGPPRATKDYFQSYKASAALSTPQHSVFERHDDGNHGHSERLWVRNADRMIVRYEGLRNGVVQDVAEITSQVLDRPLTDADLSHEVPLLTRYSLKNDPRVFIAGLFGAAGLVGALVWGRLFSRAASLEDFARTRRRLWRVQFWISGVVAIVLAALGALAAVSHGASDSGLVLVFFLSIACAIGFALAVCFTLVSYPVEWLLTRGARRGKRQAG
jgi:hypothetical protein